MPQPLIELGGTGAVIHLAPANGFPPQTYLPALTPLLARHRVVSLPPRAMWPEAGAPPAAPGSWATLADDLLHGLIDHQLPPLIGIGHSFGAVVSLLAANRARPKFTALALLDPTILPPSYMDHIRAQRERGETSFRPLVQGARKRRDRFESASEAFGYWRDKPLFADWSDAALGNYVAAMLRPVAAGGYTLTWSPAWEAHYYESFYTESWQDLSTLDRSLPLLIIHGSTSDTFLPAAAQLLRERFPHAEMHSVSGHGHLFPQSAPEATGRIVADWIKGLTAP